MRTQIRQIGRLVAVAGLVLAAVCAKAKPEPVQVVDDDADLDIDGLDFDD